MINLDELKQYKHIYMIGIGGTSMSGIATILNKWGFYVAGSDANSSELVDKLKENNIPVVIGHNLDSLRKADLVVYTAAISPNDIELQEAKRLNIKTMERSDFLGLITKAFHNTISISGTHGKTTTTSMISLCFLEAHKDPTIQVGAILKQIGGNYRVGNSDCFILESCEYVESFLKFHPRAEIILNIDNDHLDYFKDLDHIKNSFIKFVQILPNDGLLVLNADDANCIDLYKNTKAKVVTYGIENEKCNFIARNITFDDNGFPLFDVYRNNSFYKSIKLSVPGMHNVYNALACIATCYEYGIDKEIIKSGLLKYTGAHRRFELVGSTNGAYVYDDYGHHPTEIKAVYNAMKKKKYNRSWVIFQPHTYSRTKTLLTDFSQALSGFDNVIITDIYAARESNTLGISSQDLVDLINLNRVGKKALYMSDFNEIAKYIRDRVMPNDIVLTIGAGTVTNIGPMIVGNK
ncbi:MAG: UDP-N-acetylmuramate--L-alanine ligase [Clostridia bacterium]